MKVWKIGMAACFVVGMAQARPQEWSESQTPFRIHGSTYYVGTRGLSAILIASPEGLVLIDGTLPENAAQVEANIRSLGFRLGDVRLILNSHAHGDHAGAIAALARDSGARVMASPAGAKALREGGDDVDDPQHGESLLFPSVRSVQELRDGQTLHVGDIAITAHFTPGHTPGGTSWTWRSCEGKRCLSIAYVDSLTAVSAPGYRYSEPAHAVVFRHSLEVVAALPCDILLTPHPDASGLLEKVARRGHGGADPLVDAGACRAFADEARSNLEAVFQEESKGH